MVDFQSRDTRRDRGDDEDDDPEDDGAPDDGHDEAEHEGDQDHEEHGHEDHDHGHGHGHDHHHHDVEALGTAVVTVSSSRTLDDDPAGDAIAAAMDAEGEVVTRELVGDDHDTIQGTVDNLANRDDVNVVVTTGGTGVTPDDVTIEAVRPLFEKELPGFGELFRILSHEEIGTKVVGTRATAGVVGANDEGYGSVPVFCLPGSENAARLGAEEIISEEAGHLAGLASRD
jgi:molybdenum cofactor biosynthesis protein B